MNVVPPRGFEPLVSTLKGWRPRPLDDGGVRKLLEYNKAETVSAMKLLWIQGYRFQAHGFGKPKHNVHVLNGLPSGALDQVV